jgi:hypothetical protein
MSRPMDIYYMDASSSYDLTSFFKSNFLTFEFL